MSDEPQIIPANPEPGKVRLWHRQDAYGAVLLLIAASLFLEALRDTVWLAGIVGLFVRVFTMALVLRTTRSPVATLHSDWAFIAAALLIGGAGSVVAVGEPHHAGQEPRAAFIPAAVSVIVIAVQILVISRRLLRRGDVDRSTAGGALAVYLLIGSLSAGVYGMIASGDGSPFFTNGTDGSSLERLYFSFITLTTVGFGDFTPATNLGKITVVMEALTGQLYLVTVVALVIGGLGSSRARRGGE